MTNEKPIEDPAPIDLQICIHPSCGGVNFIKEIAAACDLYPIHSADVHGSEVTILGQKYRLECHNCLRGCASAPYGNIIVDGKDHRTTVGSIESLQQQVAAINAGTWNRADYRSW